MTGDGALAGIALAGFAALTTALAHALLKAGEDKLAVRAWIGVTGLVAMAVPAALAGLPDARGAGWLAAALALHAGYQLVLIRSYQTSDFSLAFPVARGAVPLATTALAALWFAERPAPLMLAGAALVSGGIVALARGGMTARGIVWALVAGAFTTAYTLVDAAAVRAAPTAVRFIAWFFVGDGVVMPAIMAAARGPAATARSLAAGWRPGVRAGLVALVSFGAALAALRLAPVGAVSALRECSVAASLFVAWRVLGERIDRRRVCCAGVITLGAVLVVAGVGTGGS